MWAAIGAALGIVALLLKFFLKKKNKTPAQILVGAIERKKKKRAKAKAKGADHLAVHDMSIRERVAILLREKARRDSAKRSKDSDEGGSPPAA